MKHRSPLAVFFLSLLTFGIYSLYLLVVTKGEMNSLGAKIPTAWLVIVPIVSIWWLWKYGEGVEQVTGGKLSGVLAFVLIWLVGPIGQAIVQDSFNNNVSAQPASPGAPAAALAPETTTPPAPTTEQPTPPPVEPPATTPPATPSVQG